MVFFFFLDRNEETVKKEMRSCDCCGEDLATAHTV